MYPSVEEVHPYLSRGVGTEGLMGEPNRGPGGCGGHAHWARSRMRHSRWWWSGGGCPQSQGAQRGVLFLSHEGHGGPAPLPSLDGASHPVGMG